MTKEEEMKKVILSLIFLLSITVFSYDYKELFPSLDEIEIVQHLQGNVAKLDILDFQKQALLNLLYEGIQQQLQKTPLYSNVQKAWMTSAEYV